MSNYIDVKYLNLLSSQLGQFKRKNDKLWNFRCPYCGDSQKDKTKARGYVIHTPDAKLIYKCHNCGASHTLAFLIKHVNPTLYKQYSMESYKDRVNKSPRDDDNFKYKKADISRFEKPRYLLSSPLSQIKKISQLKVDHPARDYVNRRKIPASMHYELFYAPKFYKWVNECVPNKFDLNKIKDEPRLIIPFIDENQRLLGFQGRAFGKSELKYITIMLDESAPKIYGLNRVDWNKPVVIVEGPIDSMFLDNAIAMAGADTSKFENADIVYCWDNEPRSSEIVKRIERAIDENKSVVIFPTGIEEKDINDMILRGRDPMEIQAIISNNTYNGLIAKAKLSEWRKV
jgi:transcription elongation factor Elf1